MGMLSRQEKIDWCCIDDLTDYGPCVRLPAAIFLRAFFNGHSEHAFL